MTLQQLHNKGYSKSSTSIQEIVSKEEKQLLQRQQSMPCITLDNENDHIADDEVQSILQKKETMIEYTIVGEDVILFDYEEEPQKKSKKSVLNHLIKFFNK